MTSCPGAFQESDRTVETNKGQAWGAAEERLFPGFCAWFESSMHTPSSATESPTFHPLPGMVTKVMHDSGAALAKGGERPHSPDRG